MDFPLESVHNIHCPEETPILCGKKRLAKGLCVRSEEECDVRTSTRRAILDFPENARGKNYAYSNEFLGRGCYVNPSTLVADYHKDFKDYDVVPENFSLLTYNIWGLVKNENLKKLFGLRKKLLLKTLNETEADMFCLQEISAESYNLMKDWIQGYAFASEVPYVGGPERNRTVDTYFVSKYRPKSIDVYGIEGVLSYKNALMVVTYPNLVVYNLYSQAGSKASAGQERTWIHYSRCRYDILDIIYTMMPKKGNVIICGDFNFDLDGDADSWPETDMLEKFKHNGFVDTYRSIHKVGGLTEDTDKNPMRWNQKLAYKMYRYDAILYRPAAKSWAVSGSKTIGHEITYLGEKDSEWFYNNLSEAKKQADGLSKLKGLRRTKKGYKLPINASDHFGVLTKFKMPIRRWVTRKAPTKNK